MWPNIQNLKTLCQFVIENGLITYIRISRLKRREFRTFLEDLECDYGGLAGTYRRALIFFQPLRGNFLYSWDMVNRGRSAITGEEVVMQFSIFCRDLSNLWNILNVGLQGKGKNCNRFLRFYSRISNENRLMGLRIARK